MKDYIETVIAPKLQGDGGWIEVLSYENHVLKVYLQGECSKCNIVPRCMEWIKSEVKRDMQETIEIEEVRKKPFFWDQN